MMGRHTIKHWSSTQSSISLSSGEAEFSGVVKAAGQGLGFQALLSDLGISLPLRVWTDSSAAIGIAERQGLGKLRHVSTHLLWVQQAVRTRRIDLRKIRGDANPADLLTKFTANKDKLDNLVKLFGCEFRGGRAQSSPMLRTGAGTQITLKEAEEINYIVTS